MKLNNTITALAFTVTILSSCGGGGGGSATPKSYAGVWQGSLYETANTCPFIPSNDYLVAHKVDQSGSRVVLNVPSGITTYEGTTDGNEGFTVAQEVINQPVGNGVSCRLLAAIKYVGTDENTALVDQAERYECSSGSGKNVCEVKREGEVYRQK